MNFENSFCLIPLSSSNQKYRFLFQRIEWHPNPTDFELCTMKGKSKVSTYFLIFIFPHIYNLLDRNLSTTLLYPFKKMYSSTFRLYYNRTATHVNCNGNYTIINEKCF